jgi:acyl dehydratase
MAETFLSPVSHSNFTQTSDLTPTQNQIDGLVSSLAEKTADAYALAGVFVGVGGGRAFHRGALSLFSPLTNFASGISAPLSQLTARVVGFAAESALFGITPNIARATLQNGNLSLLQLHGEEGLGKIIVHSGINLIGFKAAGVVSAQQSAVKQVLLQTSAILGTQQASAFVGITDVSRNSFGHQIIDAQSSVLTMWAGIHCLHQLTPNSAARQSAKVLEIEGKQVGIASRRKYDSHSSLKPAVELAGRGGVQVITYEPPRKVDSRESTTMLNENKGEGGGKKEGIIASGERWFDREFVQDLDSIESYDSQKKRWEEARTAAQGGSGGGEPVAISEAPASKPREWKIDTSRVRLEGDKLVLDFEGDAAKDYGWARALDAPSERNASYGRATKNDALTRRGIASAGLTTSEDLPILGKAIEAAPADVDVLHAKETVNYYRPVVLGEPRTTIATQKVRGGKLILSNREKISSSGEKLVSSSSMLMVGKNLLAEIKPTILTPEEIAQLPPLTRTEQVTWELIRNFAKWSGDHNPVHLIDGILHGMATFNFAEAALYQAQGTQGPGRPITLEATFKGPTRVGDTLRFYVVKGEKGATVKVINQRAELIMTLEQKPLEDTPQPSASIEGGGLQPVERVYGKAKVVVNVEAGLRTVQRTADEIAPLVPQIRDALGARVYQPWTIAGVSDGMGLDTAIASLLAGTRNMIGPFFEPDMLLRKKSAVHLGRLAHVEGLRVFAQQRGLNFTPLYEDTVLPQLGAETKPLPPNLARELEAVRKHSWNPDLIFINSIAGAGWISPSPGLEQLKGVPGIDLQGRVVLMDMKPYEEAGYQGTLNVMGRNHGALLNALTSYFGPTSVSSFYTWGGGSQNRRVLRGIYSGSVLGHSKEIGETAAVEYHLASQQNDFARGFHKVSRFPAFDSVAIYLIPGAAPFKLIGSRILKENNHNNTRAELAALNLIETFGGINNLANPLAQTELDISENYYLPQISANLSELHRRVAARAPSYRADYEAARRAEGKTNEMDIRWNGAFDLETSKELLDGLVDPDYLKQIPKPTG